MTAAEIEVALQRLRDGVVLPIFSLCRALAGPLTRPRRENMDTENISERISYLERHSSTQGQVFAEFTRSLKDRVAILEARLASYSGDQTVPSVDALNQITHCLDERIENRTTDLEERTRAINERIDGIEKRTGELEDRTLALDANARFERSHHKRIEDLELRLEHSVQTPTAELEKRTVFLEQHAAMKSSVLAVQDRIEKLEARLKNYSHGQAVPAFETLTPDGSLHPAISWRSSDILAPSDDLHPETDHRPTLLAVRNFARAFDAWLVFQTAEAWDDVKTARDALDIATPATAGRR